MVISYLLDLAGNSAHLEHSNPELFAWLAQNHVQLVLEMLSLAILVCQALSSPMVNASQIAQQSITSMVKVVFLALLDARIVTTMQPTVFLAQLEDIWSMVNVSAHAPMSLSMENAQITAHLNSITVAELVCLARDNA